MFRVFQLISDTMMSIDLVLFFIACFLRVSLSLYFMSLKRLKSIVFFLAPCLSLNKSFLIWECLVWLFLLSYILVRYSQLSTSLMTCALLNEWHLEAYTVVSHGRHEFLSSGQDVVQFLCWTVTVLSFAAGDQSLERHLRPWRSPVPYEN